MDAETKKASTSGHSSGQPNSSAPALDPNSFAAQLKKRFGEFATNHPILAVFIPFGPGAAIATGGDRVNILNAKQVAPDLSNCKLPATPEQRYIGAASVPDDDKT